MSRLVEVRKEDELFFIGSFWIIANSLSEIRKGNFEIIGEKIAVDYNGNPINKTDTLIYSNRGRWRQQPHKELWNKLYKDKYKQEYDYYPRGRVQINNNGETYINIPYSMNFSVTNVIDAIIREYGLGKLKIAHKIELSLQDDDFPEDNYYYYIRR